MSDLVFPFAEHTYVLRLKSRQKFPSQLVLVEQVALRRESFFCQQNDTHVFSSIELKQSFFQNRVATHKDIYWPGFGLLSKDLEKRKIEVKVSDI